MVGKTGRSLAKRGFLRGLIAGYDLHRQATARGFAVFGVHIFTGFVHGLDNLIETDARFAGAAQRHTCRVYRLHGGNRVTLDARNLYLSGNRIAGQPQVVFHADFGSDAHLRRACAQQLRQTCRRHGARHADFTLTAHFRTGNGGVHLIQRTNRTGNQQVARQRVRVHFTDKLVVVRQYGRNDAAGTVGWRGDHTAGYFKSCKETM